MDIFKALKKGFTVISLSMLIVPVWGAQGSESSQLEEMMKRVGQLVERVEASDGARAEERKQFEQTVRELATLHANEINNFKTHHDEALKALEERFKEYKNHVAAVLGGKKPIFYQEITANKLLLGISVCSVCGFLTNLYYAYHETGSIFFGLFRASRDTLKDFVTYYYGAKILEQVGTITGGFVARTPQSPDKKDK